MTDEHHHDYIRPPFGEPAPKDEPLTPRPYRAEEQGQPYIAIDHAKGESKTRVIIGDDVFAPLAELEAALAQAAQDATEADAYAAVMVERDELRVQLQAARESRKRLIPLVQFGLQCERDNVENWLRWQEAKRVNEVKP